MALAIHNFPWNIVLALGFSSILGDAYQETDPTSLAIVSLGGYMAWKGSRKPDQTLKKKSDEPSILSSLLKSETKELHEKVENHPFVRSIQDGSLVKQNYTLYLRDLLEVYRILEKNLHHQKTHPKLKYIYFPELFRTSALEKDLDAFGGSLIKPTPAAAAYAEHLENIANKSPYLLSAHAYVRYMGDLSGGQQMGKCIKKLWGDKIAFYSFPEIKSLVEAKKSFRNGLNALPLTETDKKQICEEAKLAFRMTEAIFDEVD